MSWSVSDPNTTQVALSACSSPSSCSVIGAFNVPTFSADWAPTTEQFQNGGYMHFGAVGGGLASPFTFYQFTPSSSMPEVTCNPAAQAPSGPPPVTAPCTILANGIGTIGGNSNLGDIPGDPPSTAPPGAGLVFQGYADPSIRADAFVTTFNPAGNNLWMSYSYPKISTVPLQGGGYAFTPLLEIHLAKSNSSGGGAGNGGHPGGWVWSAYCDSATTCPLVTPIYPSPTTSSTSGGNPSPFEGQVWVLDQFGNYGPIPSDHSGVYYSSHEVSNLAQYVNGNAVYWYAVHLMYFVPEGGNVQESLVNGCLVISMAPGSPAFLAWPNYTDKNPQDGDPAHFASPLSSYPLEFGNPNVPSYSGAQDLNSLAGSLGCTTWGEPAIMAAPAPSGYSGEWLYLAAECITNNRDSNTYVGQAYYVFYNPINSNGTVSSGNWAAYPPGGPIMTFSMSDLNSILPPGLSFPNAFLNEFDWAVRADGSMVAVATPETVSTGQPPVQSGCVAVTFDLYASGSPFTAFTAYVFDADTGDAGGTSESNGPNACTYEPTSNTGIAIVRHLVNTTQYQIYSIVNTGVMP